MLVRSHSGFEAHSRTACSCLSVAILALIQSFLTLRQPSGSLPAIPGLPSAPCGSLLIQPQSAMPTYYSETLVDAVNKLLATPAKEQSIITSWKKILQLLFEANVMKPEKQLIHCKYILCHPKNRAGFMLNGFNAQANGVKVKRIGANREELHGAVVIELSPFPSERNL